MKKHVKIALALLIGAAVLFSLIILLVDILYAFLYHKLTTLCQLVDVLELCQQLLASFHLVLGCLVDIKDLSLIGLDGLYGIVQDRLQGICAQITRLVQEFFAASHHRLLTFPHRCSGCAS